MKGFRQFMATIGVYVVIASLMYGLSAGSAPGGALHAIGAAGLHITIVAALAIVLAPPLGSFFTLSVAEIVRRTSTAATLLRVLNTMRALYWVLLLGSLAFPLYAHWQLRWPVWQIAYGYAAIVGVLLGALLIIKDLRTHVTGASRRV